MPIASHVFIVNSAVPPGIEDDWNRWYNEVHLPEIGDCPGFVSAQRFVCEDASGRRYVAIYELDSLEAMKSAELAARRGWAQFTGQVEYRSGVFSKIAGHAPSRA